MRVLMWIVCCGVLLLPSLAGQTAPARYRRLTEQELRGKQIYLRGKGTDDREIRTVLSDDAMELPATSMPCVGCHGIDGKGRPEGGVIPSNITWSNLTKIYGHTHEDNRQHPPYDDDSLVRAISLGFDPAGNRMAVAMPRYRMSVGQMADLIAYLKKLEHDHDPGITDTTITIGTILPAADSRLAEQGQAVRQMLTAYFTDLNQRGGVFSRKIELLAVDAASTPAETGNRTAAFLAHEEVFALVSPYIAGAENETTALAGTEEIPVIGPLTLLPRTSFPLNRQVFYLLSGLPEQARALLAFTAQHLKLRQPQMAVVHPQVMDEPVRAAIAAVEEECNKTGHLTAHRFSYGQAAGWKALAAQLKDSGSEAILFSGSSQDALLLLNECVRQRYTPQILLFGLLLGPEVFSAPVEFRQNLYAVFPALPTDQTPVGMQEYRALLEKNHLSMRHAPMQLSALAAARVLVEGLRRAGRELSREKLIAELEGFYELETGLIPRLTYGPNRRIGAAGAHVVRIDPEHKSFTESRWIIPQ